MLSHLLEFFIRLCFSGARIFAVIHDVMRALRPRVRVVRPHTRRPSGVSAGAIAIVARGDVECGVDGVTRVFLVDGHTDDGDAHVDAYQVEDDGGEEADETKSAARRREQPR